VTHPLLLQAQTAAERFESLRGGPDIPLGQRLIGVLGIAAMIGLAVLMSYDRRRINWRLVASGLALQVVFGLLVLKTSVGRDLFQTLGGWITALLGFQEQGARFVFGNLVQSNVPVGSPDTATGALDTSLGMVANTGAFFAFNVLPTIIFFSALMSVLYYLGIMQWIVKGLAWGMQKTLRTSGAETLSASGNIFLGQTESPLLIKPFIATMTRSELNTVMVGGFATVAKPPTITVLSSERVIVPTNGLMRSGASVCPRKMFPDADSVSAPLVRSVFCIPHASPFTINCITPR